MNESPRHPKFVPAACDAMTRMAHLGVSVHPQLLWDRAYLPEASLLWLSPDTTRLMVALAATVPLDLRQVEMPFGWETGLAVFGSPVGGVDTDSPNPIVVNAVAWGRARIPVPPQLDTAALTVSSWKWHDESLWVPLGRSDWLTREQLGEVTAEHAVFAGRAGSEAFVASVIDDRRLLVALRALINDPSLTRVEPLPQSPAAARKHRRSGAAAPRTVNVVNLHSTPTGAAHPHRSGTFRHRWYVRPHMRWQACGPNRAQRSLVIVRGHIKGPDGAEFASSRTVHRL